MASSSIFRFIICIILLVNLTQGIKDELFFEEGYSVTTIIDGDKLNVNPNSVFSLYGSSSDLIILDSVKSTFYRVSFSDSQVSEMKKLSGSGVPGYKDGDMASAMFDKPKSFAVDRKNNIYIADKTNHVVRKISKSGVTTIAGGYVQKTGKADGAAQNASFSDDFELAFDSQRCALLISDHGNRLVRLLNLKPQDCSSGSVLGSTTAWGIGVGVACLIGLIIGFIVRPYVLPHEASGDQHLNLTWKHYLISLEKQVVTSYFVIKNAIASPNHIFNKILTLSFSQLLLLFGLNIISRPPPTPVSLLDCDDLLPPVKSVSCLDYDHLVNNETAEALDLVDELKDLIAFDSRLSLEHQSVAVEEKKEGLIDAQIYANFVGFVEGGKKTCLV